MKTSKFTEQQIVFALQQAAKGVKVPEVCRTMGIHEATFYNWKKKYNECRPHSSLENLTPEEIYYKPEKSPESQLETVAEIWE